MRVSALAHPTEEMLTAYATGVATEGLSLLVAAHATYCAECRAEIARIEAIAAQIMREDESAPVNGSALDAVLARLDEPVAPPPAVETPYDPVLPLPVVEALGAPLNRIRWRFLMPGVSRSEIASRDDEQISLLRVRPGCGVPAHTHTGIEATLVLCGALNDRGRVFGPGDVAIATSDDDHHPRAEPGADCICMAVISGGLRFTGTFSRALNLFAE